MMVVVWDLVIGKARKPTDAPMMSIITALRRLLAGN